MKIKEIKTRMENLLHSKNPTTKEKHFGIEFECLYPSQNQGTIYYQFWTDEWGNSLGYRQMHQRALNNIALHLIDLKIDKYISFKYDSSIIYHNNESPLEITLCIPQSKLDFVMKRFKAVILKNRLKVNHSCGLHVHLDMRHRDYYKAFERLVNSQNLLYSMQPTHRRNNRFCQRLHNNDFDLAYESGSRYRGINPMSIQEHQTIEIRMGAATLNTENIIKWCQLLNTITRLKVDKPINSQTQLRLSKKLKAYAKKERANAMS